MFLGQPLKKVAEINLLKWAVWATGRCSLEEQKHKRRELLWKSLKKFSLHNYYVNTCIQNLPELSLTLDFQHCTAL